MRGSDLAIDLRHGVRIARAEFVRSVRQYTSDWRRIAGLAIAALFLGGNFLFALPGVFFLGTEVERASAVPFLDQIAVAIPAFLVGIGTLRTVERIGAVEAEALVLTTVHHRAVVVGLLLAELGRLSLWFGIPLVLAVGAFGLGLGAPWLLLSVGLVAVPLVACATIWGYALGIAILRLLRRLPSVRRLLKGLAVLLFLVVILGSQVAGQFLASTDVSLGRLVSLLAVPPLTEYVELAFLGTPLGTGTSPTGAGVGLLLLALAFVGLRVATGQAFSLWFEDAGGPTGARNAPAPDVERSASTRDEATGEVSDAGTVPSGARHFAPPGPFARTPATRVAWAHLLRVTRKPQELAHLIMIVFFAGPFLGSLTAGGGLAAHAVEIAGASVALGVYLAGGTFGLNPLGDDRPQLPVLLLVERPPATLLQGRAVAGVVVGGAFVVLGPLATVAIGLPPLQAVAFVLGGLGWSVCATGLALGLGAAYPIHEEREIWGTTTVSPSTIVLMTYSVVTIGGTAVGLLVLRTLLAGDVSPSIPLLIAIAAYVAVTVGVPYAGYRYAVGRYASYSLD